MPGKTEKVLNQETHLEFTPVSEIPESRLFISESNHAFDIDELVAQFTAHHAFNNPYTRSEFTAKDWSELLKKEKINEAITNYVAKNIKLLNISGDVLQQFGSITPKVTKATSPLSLSTALIDFSEFLQSIPPEQKEMIDNIPIAKNHMRAVHFDSIDGFLEKYSHVENAGSCMSAVDAFGQISRSIDGFRKIVSHLIEADPNSKVKALLSNDLLQEIAPTFDDFDDDFSGDDLLDDSELDLSDEDDLLLDSDDDAIYDFEEELETKNERGTPVPTVRRSSSNSVSSNQDHDPNTKQDKPLANSSQRDNLLFSSLKDEDGSFNKENKQGIQPSNNTSRSEDLPKIKKK